MPPIPIYSQSPISAAAKPTGVTPETAPPADVVDQSRQQPATATRTGAAVEGSAYPPARPGQAPYAPIPTGAARATQEPPVRPTPTTRTEDGGGPPAPQPGAVPVPGSGGGHTSYLPPPPKAGEKFVPPTQTAAPQGPGASFLPPQMNIPAPTMPYAQRGTAPATGPAYSQGNPDEALEHPPGYHQNTSAADMPSYARPPASTFSSYESGSTPGGLGNEDDEGVWDTARKFVQTAGKKLSEAESEVWRRINKN